MPPKRTNQAEQAAAEILQIAQAAASDPKRFFVYRDDPLGFCENILGVRLWAKQRDVLEAVRDHKLVAIKSGHNVGKTFIMACLTLWWLYARGGIVISTAPTKIHLEEVLWKEIHARIEEAKVHLPGEKNLRDISITNTWFASGVTTDQDGAFQGRHGELLIIGDEAAALSEKSLLEMETCASGAENRLVLIGNPTVTSGTFYRAFKSPDWFGMTISCLMHPNVVEQREVIKNAIDFHWVERKRREWGEESPLWDSRIAGEFPSMGTRQVVPLGWVERAQNEERRKAAETEAKDRKERYVAGLDVARYGNNRCVLYVRRGDAVCYTEAWGHSSLVATARRAAERCKELGVDTLVIDAAGIGAGVYDILEQERLPFSIYGYNGGAAAFQRNTYSNRRSELWWHMRQRFEKERLWLPQPSSNIEDTLTSDLTAPTYEITPNGKIKVETKENLLDRGEPSPDFADALSLCFAADANPEEELEVETAPQQDPNIKFELRDEGSDFPSLPHGF